EEFKSGSLQPISKPSCDKVPFQSNGNKVPNSKDWRHQGAVTSVKNQGNSCKACWAFAVVSNVESQWAIKTKVLKSLSTQELLDCSDAGNCSSGYIDLALLSVVKKGLMSEESYRYKADVEHCHQNQNQVVAKIKRCLRLNPDESEMKQYVSQNGTITTLVNLGGLQHYTNGILRSNCPTNPTDHAVMIAGYSVEGNLPYWIVKNSWGTKWGEKGYVRIYRGENTCGIRKYPMSAEV
ncbi:cathepsin L-like, partial [Mustelus asterias]